MALRGTATGAPVNNALSPCAAEGKWDEELKGLQPKEENLEGVAASAFQYVPKASLDDASLEEERPQKRARSSRAYMPRVGTNNDAFLITLLQARARRPRLADRRAAGLWRLCLLHMQPLQKHRPCLLHVQTQIKRARDPPPTKDELMARTEASGINDVSVYGAAAQRLPIMPIIGTCSVQAAWKCHTCKGVSPRAKTRLLLHMCRGWRELLRRLVLLQAHARQARPGAGPHGGQAHEVLADACGARSRLQLSIS